MVKRNNKIKQQHLLRAKVVINNILDKEKFKVTKKIKYGPRYYVALGIRHGQKNLFKICLYPRSYVHLTNQKFSREINFLNYIWQSNNQTLKKLVPRIYASGLQPRAWYIREYLPGSLQNINNGNIRFKKTFFNQKNLNWIIKAYKELQKIPNTSLPSLLKKLYPPQTPKYLWRFVHPYASLIDKYLKMPGATTLIKKQFTLNSSLYNSAPRVLAHQEPYASHWIEHQGTLKLIDWENLGWANAVHDIVVLWMRSYQQPIWQKKLYREFKEYHKSYKKFDELWIIETFIQSTFNIIGFHFYKDKKDFSGLVKYSIKNIKNILNNNFKLPS